MGDFFIKSIKEHFKDLILEKGQITLDEVHFYARVSGKKESTLEREIRKICEGENAEVEPTRNEKGFINGYRKKSNQQLLF